jgi:hypothetical protein
MSALGMQKNRRQLFRIFSVLLFCLSCIFACNDDSHDSDETEADDTAAQWDYVSVNQIEARGLLSPDVRAAIGASGDAQIAYFQSNVPQDPEDDITYTIHHVVWDTDAMENIEEASVIEVDNCMGLGFALDAYDVPVVAYQGGTLRECGQPRQGDAMFSIRESDEWEEHLGAMGEVDQDRNPVFQDGFAGADVSVAFDSQGDMHLCYQFRYEGCDSMNFAFPDLYYVKKDRNDLGAPGVEEQVEGNTYVADDVGYQNRAGDYCSIAIDGNDEPAIFYYAELPSPQGGPAGKTRGLRVARRQGGVWIKEWVDQGCEVGDIAAACTVDGYLGVAYYALAYTDGQGYSHEQCLKYAEETESSSWDVQLVDETSLCGKYCSLAFDAAGVPSIAYYSMKSHSGYALNDLKLARLNGDSWDTEVVATDGDIGLYNSLCFDDNDETYIFSYSDTDKTVYLFFE